jgi:hypothetical protein
MSTLVMEQGNGLLLIVKIHETHVHGLPDLDLELQGTDDLVDKRGFLWRCPQCNIHKRPENVASACQLDCGSLAGNKGNILDASQ